MLYSLATDSVFKKHIPTQPYKTTGKIIVNRNEAEDELGQTGLKKRVV
jgi:hypothetical protein